LLIFNQNFAKFFGEVPPFEFNLPKLAAAENLLSHPLALTLFVKSWRFTSAPISLFVLALHCLTSLLGTSAA
jgi:hypothetical protein